MRSLIAILGPTATGKSALGIAIAERFNGEIINCDSTAVYRGFDIGTDKVPLAQRRGIAHHLIDIADQTMNTPPRSRRDAAAAVDDIHARGRCRSGGGTGFYYRALTAACFRTRQGRQAARAAGGDRGQEGRRDVHRMVARVDPESGARIQPRDLKRLVRALEVYFQTGKPLTAHFEDTVSPLAADVQVGAIALRMPAPWLAERLARRVDEQFEAGLLDEIRRLLAAGVPPDARPFGGLVYRQAMDYLNGVRSEADTWHLLRRRTEIRARQLIWFRKELTCRLTAPALTPKCRTA